ncbi:MAG: hypothetical protein JWP36_1296 [Paucimonas sp.]|jgi:hypothetical protein|nr:hypothetical protein [Paucimonas sp.]
MQVRVVHDKPEGGRAELGIMDLQHMPPLGEPFPIDDLAYRAKAYFGPDSEGQYLLVVEGKPVPLPPGSGHH